MPVGIDPITVPPSVLMTEVEVSDIQHQAARLVDTGRISNEAYMALVLGLGCLKEALRNPALRKVGADLRVTWACRGGAS